MNQGRIIVITGAPGTGKTTNTVEKRKEIINVNCNKKLHTS